MVRLWAHDKLVSHIILSNIKELDKVAASCRDNLFFCGLPAYRRNLVDDIKNFCETFVVLQIPQV